MKELLQFILSDFWIFLGTALLILLVGGVLGDVIRELRGK